MMIFLQKLGSLPHRMSPVAYVRTMMIFIGLQYSSAVCFAALDFHAPAIILVVTATLGMTHLMSIVRNS